MCVIFQLTIFSTYLVEVIKDDAELAKLLDSSRHVDVTIQVNGKRGLVDDRLHARYSEIVVAVVKPGVDQAFFAEAEDLPTCQGACAELFKFQKQHLHVHGLAPHMHFYTLPSQSAIMLSVQACPINSNQGLIQHH